VMRPGTLPQPVPKVWDVDESAWTTESGAWRELER
jgi:hypothetical protein